MSPRPPKLSDPGSSPRFPYRGAARREKPIWRREQFGPWTCDVLVVPIVGMRAGYPVFEVNVHWMRGPALDESLGVAPPTGMEARDVFYVDRQAPDMQLSETQAVELAVELGRRAADLLQEGVKPDLRALARAIRQRIKQ